MKHLLVFILLCTSAFTWNLELVEILEVHDAAPNDCGWFCRNDYPLGTSLVDTDRMYVPPFGGYWQASDPKQNRNTIIKETASVRFVPHPEQAIPRIKEEKTQIYERDLLLVGGVYLKELSVEHYEWIDNPKVNQQTFFPSYIRKQVYLQYKIQNETLNITLQGTYYSLPANTTGWLPVYSNPVYEDKSYTFETLMRDHKNPVPVYIRNIQYKKEFIPIALL